MKKVFKLILIIIFLAFLFIVGRTVRNFMIVSDLQNKIMKYNKLDSYYKKIVNKDLSNNSTVTSEVYRNSDRELLVITANRDGDLIKTSIYKKNKVYNVYTEHNGEKEAELDANTSIEQSGFYNTLESNSKLATFTSSFPATIRSKTVNGKDCYEIENYFGTMTMYEEGKNVVYVEKDTGLLVEMQTPSVVSDYSYDFDYVKDSVFREPDISEYNVKGEN